MSNDIKFLDEKHFRDMPSKNTILTAADYKVSQLNVTSLTTLGDIDNTMWSWCVYLQTW